MSHSPERISSYRRHFEDSTSSSYQVRESSPSPTRRDVRHTSAGYSRSAGAMRGDAGGRRTVSAARKVRVGAGAVVCVGYGGEAAIDLDAAAAENQAFLSTRSGERQEMVVLNDRLAVYIDKVRSLEQQNRLLETEIEAYQNRFLKPSGLRLLYEEQLKGLMKIADQLRAQKDMSIAAKGSMGLQLEALKIRYEEAIEMRRKAELDIEAFRPDVDKATSSRIALEKQLEQLEAEIEFLKRVHQQEIDELMRLMYSAQVSVESAFDLPDLATALKQIQTQYDDIAAKNLQEMDSWYKNKFQDLTSKTSRHVDKVRSGREELASAKKDIQCKDRDLETLTTKNETLLGLIREAQEKYKKEVADLQARIEAVQLETKSTKERMALLLRDYQDLLNIKMSLEIEITTYRKLIEGEDLRLAGMVQTMSLTSGSMSAIRSVGMGGGGMGGAGGGMGGAGGIAGGMGGIMGGVGGMGGAGGVGGAGGMDGGLGGAGGMGGGMGAGGMDDMGGGVGMGAGAGGIGAGLGGASAGVVGDGGVGGVGGAGGMGADADAMGSGAGGNGGFGAGVKAGSGMGGAAGMGPGGVGGLDGTGGMGGAGMGVNGVNGGVGGVNGTGGFGAGGVGAGGVGGPGTAGMGGAELDGRMGGDGGRGGAGGMGADGMGGADSSVVGMGPGGGSDVGRIPGSMATGMGYGRNGYDPTMETYPEQAVELTERRTVLIRTVKTADDVLETEHHEQTIIITGAGDESDDDD